MAVGHRGYMEKFPENTMIAFDEALRVGAHGLETDVHVSLDGVVVICHDALLKRIYGVDATVSSLPWKNGLDQLRTLREPHSPMLTFRELLEKLYSGEAANGELAKSERTPWTDAWILMDIKIDNPIEVIGLMKKDLVAVNPDMSYWAGRMLFGIWHEEFLPECATHIPEIAISHIGLSLSYAIDHFLPWPQVKSFNLFLPALMDKRGKKFIRLVHDNNKSVLVWTVNSESWMKWAMYLKTDAVLTNDPAKYLALRDHVPSKKDSPDYWTYRDFFTVWCLNWLGYLIMSFRVWRYAGRDTWKEKLGNVEEKIVNGGMSEKVQQDIHE